MFVSGMILSLVVFFMHQSDSYKETAEGLKYFFEFFPSFSISFGLMRFANQAYNNNVCKVKNVECKFDKTNVCCSK